MQSRRRDESGSWYSSIRGGFVWFNDGKGNLTGSGQQLGSVYTSAGVDLGDLDGAVLDFDDALERETARWGFVSRAAVHILRGEHDLAMEQIGDFSRNGLYRYPG